MDEILKAVLYIFAGLGSAGIILLFLLLNPEKIEKWSALLWRLIEKLKILGDKATKQRIKLDIQGRVNEFAKDISKKVPHFETDKVRIDYVGNELTRDAFFQNDEIIIRLRRDDSEEQNFVHATYLFISTSLLFKLKRYLSPSQRQALDLYVSMIFFQDQKPSVVDKFLEYYLHPYTQNKSSKIALYFNRFGKIDGGRLFFPIFIQELDFLGKMVFGKRKDQLIIQEVDGLTEFLEPIATRKIGEENDLDYQGKYCRFAIMIIGKPSKLQASIEPYVKFIEEKLVPEGFNRIYMLGLWSNKFRIDEICRDVSDKFEVYCRRTFDRVLDYGDRRETKKQYLVVLRRIGAPVFYHSEE